MTRDSMPIMGATLMARVPFALLAPHEAQAQRNHGQTLERLAQRGGLDAGEALDIIAGRRWGTTRASLSAEQALILKVREWRAAQQPAPAVEAFVAECFAGPSPDEWRAIEARRLA